MTPSLTQSGAVLTGVAFVFVIAGALLLAWPLVALGTLLLSAMLAQYLYFYRIGVFLKRRCLEFAWWVPPNETLGGALCAGFEAPLKVLLRNQAPLPLRLGPMKVVCSSSIAINEMALSSLYLPSRKELQFSINMTPRASGYWFFHGLSTRFFDALGLFALQVYYPNLLTIKVFPNQVRKRSHFPFRPRIGALHERTGIRLVHQSGMGTDLYEIRDHLSGDPFKRIAWKATARRQKLMVREFENEIVVTHLLLLDISSTMREPIIGASKLDYGIGLCASFARLALEAGDRVGLYTFDHRIYSKMVPGEGKPHLFRLVECLMELHNITDEDLTDITTPELYAAVAEFLRFQEGIDVQRKTKPPPPNDPLWQHLVAGPKGELYFSAALANAITTALNKRRPIKGTWVHRKIAASDVRERQLRTYCRLSGLEIPFREHSFLEGKEHGLVEALKQCALARRPQFIVLVTDFEEITDRRSVLKTLQLLCMRRHSVTVIAPYGPSFLPGTRNTHQKRIENILALRAQRLRCEMQKEVQKLGIPVLTGTPDHTLQTLLNRLARFKNLAASRF